MKFKIKRKIFLKCNLNLLDDIIQVFLKHIFDHLPVNVVFSVGGQVVVDDQGHLLDVDASRLTEEKQRVKSLRLSGIRGAVACCLVVKQKL